MLIDRRFLLRSAAPALAAALLPAATFAEVAKKKHSPARGSAETVTMKDVNGLTVFGVGGCNVVALAGPDGALWL